jgi:hypothetical protein
LSASRVDIRAAKVTADATKETGGKIGTALDGVVAALIAGVAEAFQSRIDGAVKEVVSSIRGTTSGSSINTSHPTVDVPIRAD